MWGASQGCSMDYQTAIDWLYAARLRGIKLGLDNTHRLLEGLGHPEHRLRILHVAGTNGKGSTCAMMANICRAAGFRTGLFTSPHLVNFCERILINGVMASKATVADELTRIRRVCKNWQTAPTFFELTTALALEIFSQNHIELAVLETGMGGRLDATNACQPVACAITPISLDHTKWLGDSLAAIASEKAGIIKPQTPVVSAPQEAVAMEVIRRRAEELAAPLVCVEEPWPHQPANLTGLHQRWNAAVAVATCQAAGISLSEERLRTALDTTEWPGRFQRIGDWLILDGAHNEASATTLAATWRESFPDVKPLLVLGVVADKDVASICKSLAALSDCAIATTPLSERALPASSLAKEILQANPSMQVEVESDPIRAIHMARQHGRITLVAGSLFLVGALLAHLERSETSNPQPNDP